MISVGELFVSLGIKGADKTLNTLTGTKKALGGVASTSLEAKVAIVAAMYALERLFAASGAAGTGLVNFNATLGVSAKTLQQYQYAARQMGVSNQEVEASFRGLQSTITKTLMNGEAPAGLARLAQLTGKLGKGDLLKFQEHPELLIQRLQQYAQREKNLGFRNETLKSFGIGDNMQAALARGAFDQQTLNKAPTYSDKQIKSLDTARAAWSNLGTSIEMAIGKFNADHGTKLVSDIAKLVPQVLKLVKALSDLADKAKLFENIGKLLDFSAETTGKAAVGVSNIAKNVQKESGPKANMLSYLSELLLPRLSAATDLDAKINAKNLATPALPAPASTAKPPDNIEVNLNQIFQNNETDPTKVSDASKRGIQTAFRQLSAQSQAT